MFPASNVPPTMASGAPKEPNERPRPARAAPFIAIAAACKRRSDNVPRRRLDSLTMAVENHTVCHLPIESIETLMEGDKDVTSWTCICACAGRAWWRG